MNIYKISHFATKGLFTAIMIMSVGKYIFDNPYITDAFTSFGYPTYLIYPLAIAKLLGLIGIWQNTFTKLKEWAYAGFFFNVVLAFFAHFMISDGQYAFAIVALLLVLSAYFTKNYQLK
jgi:hypothetical protein